MKPTINDYARTLNQGKSFNFSTWDRAESYRNDSIKQDFVVYDNNIYVCVESVPAGKLNPAADIEKYGVDDAHWQLVLKSDKGFSEWSLEDKKKLMDAFYELTDIADVIGRADELGKNPPIINPSDGHWYFWDTEADSYKDSGCSSTGLLIKKIGFTREYGELPGYIRENQHYVLSSDKVYDMDGNELKGIGTMQRMDITLNDGSTTRAYIPDGLTITSIRQSYKALESGEDNIFTVTYNNGARTQLYVRNGMDGMSFKRVDELPVGQPFEDNYNLLNLPNSRYLYLLEDITPLIVNGLPVYKDENGNEYQADTNGVYYNATGTPFDPEEAGYSKVADPDADASFSEYLWVDNAPYLDKNGHSVYKDVNGNNYYYYDADKGGWVDSAGTLIDQTDLTKYIPVTGAYDCLGSAKVEMEDYVSYVHEQEKSEVEKTRARNNINACADLSQLITITYHETTGQFSTSILSPILLKSWTESSRRRIRYVYDDGTDSTDMGIYYNFDIQSDGVDDTFRFDIGGKYLDFIIPSVIVDSTTREKWETAPYVAWNTNEQFIDFTRADRKEAGANARTNIEAEWDANKDRVVGIIDPETGLEDVDYTSRPLSNETATDEHYPSSLNVVKYTRKPGLLAVKYTEEPRSAAWVATPDKYAILDFLSAPMKGLMITADNGGTFLDPISPEYYFARNTVTGTEYNFVFHSLELDRYITLKVVEDNDITIEPTAELDVRDNIYVRTDMDQMDYLTLVEKATARHNINSASLYSPVWEVKVEDTIVTSVTEPEDKLAWVESPFKLLKVVENGNTITIPATSQVIAEALEDGGNYHFDFAYGTSTISMDCNVDADFAVENDEWVIASDKKHLYVLTTPVENDPDREKYEEIVDPVVDDTIEPTLVDTIDMTEWLAAKIKVLSINGNEVQLDECLEGGYEALISEQADDNSYVWKWILRIAPDGTMSIVDATHQVKVTKQVFDWKEQAIARHNINAKPLYAGDVIDKIVINEEVIDDTIIEYPEDEDRWAESDSRVIMVSIDGSDAVDFQPVAVDFPLEEVEGAEYKFSYNLGEYLVDYSYKLDADLKPVDKVWVVKSNAKKLIVDVVSDTDTEFAVKYKKVKDPVARLVADPVSHIDTTAVLDWVAAENKSLFISIDGETEAEYTIKPVFGGWEATIIDELKDVENPCKWVLFIGEDGSLVINDGVDHDVKFIAQNLDNKERQIARHNVNAAALYSEESVKVTIDVLDAIDQVYPADEHLWAEAVTRRMEVTNGSVVTSVEVDAILPEVEKEGAAYSFVAVAGDYTITYSYTLKKDDNDELVIDEDSKEWTVISNAKELVVAVTFGDDKYKTPTVEIVTPDMSKATDSADFADWNAAPIKTLKYFYEDDTEEIVPFVQLNGYKRALIASGKDAVTGNFWDWDLHIKDDGTLEVVDMTHEVRVTPQEFDHDEKKQARENIQAAYNSGINLGEIKYDSAADEFTSDLTVAASLPVADYEAWKECDIRVITYTIDGASQELKITASKDDKYEFDHNCYFEYDADNEAIIITGSRAYDLPNSADDRQYLSSTSNPKIHEWKNYVQNDDPEATTWAKDAIFQYTGEEKETVDAKGVDGNTLTLKTGAVYQVTDDAVEVTAYEYRDLDYATDVMTEAGTLVDGAYCYSVMDSGLFQYNGTTSEWVLCDHGYKKGDKFYNGTGEVVYSELYVPSRLPASNATANEFLFGTDDKDINVWKKYIQQAELPTDAAAGDTYQYIGETTTVEPIYIKDHFYRFDGSDWKEVLKYTIKKQDEADVADTATGEKFYETYTLQVDGVDVADSEKLNIREDKNLVKASLYKATAADAALVDLDGNALIANKHYMKYEFNEASKMAPIYALHELAVETITDGAVIADDSVLKKYKFTMNDEELVTIDILKDLVIESGSVITADGTEVIETLADGTEVFAEAGKKYLKFIIANQEAPVYIDVRDLFDLFTVATADKIQLTISDTNEISADVVPGSLGATDFDVDTNTRLDFTGYDKTIDVGQPAHYVATDCDEEGAIKVVVDGHVTTAGEITITNVVNVNTAAHASLDGITVGACVKYVAATPAGGQQLDTTAQTLRTAINELLSRILEINPDGGKLEELTTEAKTLIGAINELNVTKNVSVTDVATADLGTGVAKAYDINQENADGTIDKKGTIEIPYSNYDGVDGTTVKVDVDSTDGVRTIAAEVKDGSITRTHLDTELNEELDYFRKDDEKATVVDTVAGKTTEEETLVKAVNVLDKEIGDVNTLTVKDAAGALAKELVAALNILDALQGDDTLTTTAQTITAAINELDLKQGDEAIEVKKDDGTNCATLSEAVNRLDTELGDDSLTVKDTKNGKTTPETEVKKAINVLDNELGEYNNLGVEVAAGTKASNIVEALNQHDDEIGDLDDLTNPADNLVEAINYNFGELLKRVKYCGTVTYNDFQAAETGAKKNDLYVISNSFIRGNKYSAGSWALCTGESPKTWAFINNNVNNPTVIKTIVNNTEIVERQQADGSSKISDIIGDNNINDPAGTMYMVSIEGVDGAWGPHHGIYTKADGEGTTAVYEVFDFGTDGNVGGGNSYIGDDGLVVKVEVNNFTTPGKISATIKPSSLTKGLMDSEINAIFALTGYPTPLTTEATTLVGAANEIDSRVGKLVDLDLGQTTDFTSIVEAINFLGFDGMMWKGTIATTAATNSFASIYPIKRGWVYNISGADCTVNGLSLTAGDWIICSNPPAAAGGEPTFIKLGSGGGSGFDDAGPFCIFR